MTFPRNVTHSLRGHIGPVHTVTYSRGAAQYCLSGGQDRTIRLWNPSKGSEIKKYEGHGYEVLSISCANDNAKFVSGGGDKTIFYWDVTTGQTIRRIPGHLGRVNAVALNDDASVVVSGSFDTTVKIWDLKAQSRSPIQSLDEARDAIQTIFVGGTEIITGSVDGHIRSYDLRKGQITSDYTGHPITSIQPTQDAQTLLVATLSSTVRLLDRKTGQALNTFRGHAHESYRCRACLDGRKEESIIMGDEEGRVWVWDLVNATPLGSIPPPKVHEKAILWTEHHPVNSEYLTASADGIIVVWGE